ncbi:hypothetical protein EMPG_10222 [Blastomyces silverae]|uniref:F-box domain-containing protein n=1 Tax=Blastomyces silverae TaxID=2060906 RepID=A0A0H1B5R7_9EURO|nr:hypothetical protein EMPG_10222 [Blastomyces silverae]
MTNPPGYPAECLEKSRQRAEDVRKVVELSRDMENKLTPSFLSRLSQCYLNPPENQRHYRPHILLVSQVTKPDSFYYFVRLPRELRDLIYGYVLHPPSNRDLIVKTTMESISYKRIWRNEIPLVPLGYGNPDSWSGREEMTSLMRVNRQFYREASEVMFSDFRFSIHARVLRIPGCNFIHKLQETVASKIQKLGLKLEVFWTSKGAPVLDLYSYDSISIFPAVRSVDFHFTFHGNEAKFPKGYAPLWPIERMKPTFEMFRHAQISFSWSSELSVHPNLLEKARKTIQSMIDKCGKAVLAVNTSSTGLLSPSAKQGYVELYISSLDHTFNRYSLMPWTKIDVATFRLAIWLTNASLRPRYYRVPGGSALELRVARSKWGVLKNSKP